MAIYKIMRIYRVQANSKTEALKIVVADPVEYEVYNSVTVVSGQKPGWASSVKKQLVGEKK